jgi:5-methyltetrahydropteroyltriglutamate--homocysteine methyltransferase
MDAFYADLSRVYREEIHDLAQAGCRYLQIDEVNGLPLRSGAAQTGQ